MSLTTQISALAQRIGQEIKAVRNEMAGISGGGGAGIPVYVQETEPSAPAIWYKTDADGAVIDILRVT